jgi:uncharacterized protein (TIGR02246 family)
MSSKIYPTAQDAETAFYDAMERADLEAMMAVWAEDEEIVCVHPGGERLAGTDQIRESWKQIFAGGAQLRVEVSQQVSLAGVMFAVRSVHESISIAGDPRRRGVIAATNVYLRTASGWRMIVHHASPTPATAQEQATPPRGVPKMFH